ncbi:hypothetical protein N8I77_000836 [Diaporthe amygdali]|uniref:EthD domain-containing protein n=1 Tax=Phomopsis amygdali TaxID=1214568 RepID=A0AAD9SRM9_PHOAM|nr:uncharacterized protein J7T55_012756 [Diaporthe amygdali]KAJ0115476.1 hypothetical protein J7T55_012756 [Diaporthe amygdali]KAK2613970.1 hypothetical protein N8I77_000836 [Diaporthe amygdali]
MAGALISVVYPSAPDAKFDLEYYNTKHMGLVTEKWGNKGLQQYWVADLRPSNGPYAIQATMLWDSVESFQKAAASEDSAAVFADVANFTNLKAVVLSGAIVKSSN